MTVSDLRQVPEYLMDQTEDTVVGDGSRMLPHGSLGKDVKANNGL